MGTAVVSELTQAPIAIDIPSMREFGFGSIVEFPRFLDGLP